MESNIRHLYDSALGLQAPGSVAITATAASSQVALNKITASARGALNGRFGEGSFDVLFYIAALDHTTGDETYTVSFNTYDINGANAVAHDSQVFTITDIGYPLVFKFDTKSLGLVDPNAYYFGLNATLAGTTPILQYWSYIAPNSAY